jgi:hypothetical protein
LRFSSGCAKIPWWKDRLFSDITATPGICRDGARDSRSPRLTWLCLGDIVGWFFRPVECVLMLKQLVDEGLVAAVVPGNHDLMALDRFLDRPDMADRMLATAFSSGQLERCAEARDFSCLARPPRPRRRNLDRRTPLTIQHARCSRTS